MIAQLNEREKLLIGAIGALIAILVNVFLIKSFLGNRADLGKRLVANRAEIELLHKRETEREQWSQRDAWLNEKMPVLGDPDVANKTLRDRVLDTAKKHTVTLDSPAPGIPTTRQNYISLPIRIEAKATWEALFEFLYDLQGPDQFLVIENCDLKVNREDKTQFRAAITVAQWFAPK